MMRDAVMMVPGIMGSELSDRDGHLLWGASARVLGQAWVTGALSRLHVTADELEQGSQLLATRVLRAPGWAPFLRGVLPYSRLTEKLTDLCDGDARAVATFPYDWRMGIDTHVSAFTDACSRQLEAWRATVRKERLGDPTEVRLVIVAHSMGGLIARLALQDSGLADNVRLLITLGTPFYGSINAVEMLQAGEGGPPVPEAAAAALARTCPGVYDLLPRYECVETSPLTYRLLTDGDIAPFGDAGLAHAARERWDCLGLQRGIPDPSPVRHVAVAGARQPTSASLRLEGGLAVSSQRYKGSIDYGDSTVWRRAAAPEGTDAHTVTQKHAALAVTDQSLSDIEDKVQDRDRGPWLGTRPIGIDLPQIAEAGTPVTVAIIEQPEDPGADPGNPNGIHVTSTALETGTTIPWGPGRRNDGTAAFIHQGLSPGLHQVSVRAGGFEPVTEIILVRSAQ